MKLSIIIPVYNEEKTITKVLLKVKKVTLPQGVDREIIVVNDASTDKTAEHLKKFSNINIYQHRKNKGKGAAVKTGIRKSKGDIILIQDADLEYNPEDYPRLINPILNEKSPVVFGTRLKHYQLKLFGKGKTPLVTHYFGNKFLTFVTNFLYGNSVSDMETGYKVFRKEVLGSVTINADRFDFEPEFTAKILKQGIKIYEVPIKVKPRGYEEGKKISWKDGFIALWTLIKYRFFD